MRRFLFAALTFASLCCFTGCGDKNEIDYGQTETPDYVFVDSHMTFTYNLQGAVSEMVKVNITSNLPASKGKITTTAEGSKYTVSISNIQCPAQFELKFELEPKENLEIDANTVYDYKLDCGFTIVRTLSDGRYILANSETAPQLNGTFLGSKAEEFLKINGTSIYTFGLSADGFYEEVVEE